MSLDVFSFGSIACKTGKKRVLWEREKLVMVIGLSRLQFGPCNHTSNNHAQSSDFFITSMTTDRIGRHEVLLSINHKNSSYNFQEKKNTQVLKETENMHRKADKEA